MREKRKDNGKEEVKDEKGLVYIDTEKIEKNPFKTFPLNEKEVERIIALIAKHGFCHFFTVRLKPGCSKKNPIYQLFFGGHHLLEACKRSGMTKVLVKILNKTDFEMGMGLLDENREAASLKGFEIYIIMWELKELAENEIKNMSWIEVKKHIYYGNGYSNENMFNKSKNKDLSRYSFRDIINCRPFTNDFVSGDELVWSGNIIYNLYRICGGNVNYKALKEFGSHSQQEIFSSSVKKNPSICKSFDTQMKIARTAKKNLGKSLSARTLKPELNFLMKKEKNPKINIKTDKFLIEERRINEILNGRRHRTVGEIKWFNDNSDNFNYRINIKEKAELYRNSLKDLIKIINTYL